MGIRGTTIEHRQGENKENLSMQQHVWGFQSNLDFHRESSG